MGVLKTNRLDDVFVAHWCGVDLHESVLLILSLFFVELDLLCVCLFLRLRLFFSLDALLLFLDSLLLLRTLLLLLVVQRHRLLKLAANLFILLALLLVAFKHK